MPDPFVTIRLDGPPRGKGRPRTRVIGKFATIYTDGKTRAYEALLKAAGIEAMGEREPLDEAISVKVLAYMPIPPSWSFSKRQQAVTGRIMPTGKPDADNILKMLDGLNHHPPRFKGDKVKRPIVWRDDAQIISCNFMKVYSANPRLEISVWRWDQ